MENKPEELNNSKISDEQEQHLLETIPLVKKIAARKLYSFYPSAVEEVAQKVIVKLWKWFSGANRKNLSGEEWKKLANTATQNEVKTFFSHKSQREVSLDEAIEKADNAISETVAGNSAAEMESLAKIVWEELKKLSLRQKYALLLQKQELILYLVAGDHCRIEEIAIELRLSKERFLQIFELLPIPDERIGELFFEASGEKITAKQVWEARSKARVKLAALLK